MKEVLSIVESFIKDLPIMAQNNADRMQMARLLAAELQEWLEEDDKEKRDRELADLLWFVLTMAILEKTDIEAEIREKASRNMLKRPANEWQTGDYYEVDAKTRKEWKEQNGDDNFYSIPR